jgi:hypothetical protein
MAARVAAPSRGRRRLGATGRGGRARSGRTARRERSGRARRSGRSRLWVVARALLALSLLPLGLAVWSGFAPVVNPGVQDCGAPVAFVAEARTNARLPRVGDPAHGPDTPALAAQPRCTERVDDRLVGLALWGGAFVVVGLLGAALGLIDDRRSLRRAARFHELLREAPADAPGPMWDRPVIPVDELGDDLPAVEYEDVEGLVVWGVVAVAVVPIVVGAGAAIDALRAVQYLPLGLAVLAAALATMVAGGVLSMVSDGVVSLRSAIAVARRAGYLVPIRPAFGWSGVQAHVLARAGVEPSAARRRVGAVTLAGVAIHAWLVVVLATVAVGQTWPGEGPPRSWLLVVGVGLACAVGIGLAPVRWRRLIVPVDRSVARSLGELGHTSPTVAVGMVVGAAFARPLLVGSALVAAVAACGGGPPIVVVLAVAVVAAAIGTLSPMTGGLGVVEAVAVVALSLAGLEPGAAAAATLLWRAATFWLPLLVGALAPGPELLKPSPTPNLRRSRPL